MEYKIGDQFKAIDTGEVVEVTIIHDDVNPINEKVVCFGLVTVSNQIKGKINKYYITQATLEKYFKPITV